jgi:6-phosphogluconate dehydrogenase
MVEQKYEIGMVGLGVMGRNLVLNFADHGYSVSGYDKDLSKVQELQTEAGRRSINAAQSLKGFVNVLSTPRAIMMLVPAGQVVDNVIHELIPQLDRGDLIIDAGNSHFKDTDLRAKSLAEEGILYMGVGVSGGEEGARHGPSLMPGGPKKAYERVRPTQRDDFGAHTYERVDAKGVFHSHWE